MIKTIDVSAFLKWAQPQLRQQSPLTYPNPETVLEVSAHDVYEFVMSQTGMSADELNAELDRLFPIEQK